MFTSTMMPSPVFSDATNAACLASYALAAYGHQPVSMAGVSWAREHASGILAVSQTDVVIAIAGTNDLVDAANDVDLLRMDLRDWSGLMAVPTDVQCTSVSGFLHHAGYAYHGILQRLESDGISLEGKRLWLTGHSLGGAAAILLQLTDMFASARCYTFGAPKVFVERKVPARVRVAVRRVTDPVVYFPLSLRHPNASTYWVRYRGAIATRMPWFYWPAAWASGAIGFLRRVPSVRGLVRGHSMARYAADLSPFGRNI